MNTQRPNAATLVQARTSALSALPETRLQFAALCYRVAKGAPQILLVTSRGAGHWILPKGWPMTDTDPAQVALREAWEEAGVKGTAHDQCLGLYAYRKNDKQGQPVDCVAYVYPVRVKSLAGNWPEQGQRRRKWLSPAKAADRLRSPDLARLVRQFDPLRLRG